MINSININKLWLFLSLLALSSASYALDPKVNAAGDAALPEDATKKGIYRNVNEDGVVEFSDQSSSSNSSKQIKLKTSNTFKPAAKKYTPRPSVRSKSNSKAGNSASRYSKLEISSPTADQQIRSNQQTVTVSIAISPALNIAAGDRIELYYDGKSQGKKKTTVFNLKDVYRGQHRVQAKVVNSSGTVLKISKPIQFVIHKFSVLLNKKAKSHR
ncbi:hypothetical protein MNBD_GAMMA22-2402 [hydrothermal vent metagenome]|uniref:DUF4124 domain-containing protein n=1 Tax=hydrothermal vent metagenome TaxID=652676 RepID=A0A3B0ZVR9_9ZZZZ